MLARVAEVGDHPLPRWEPGAHVDLPIFGMAFAVFGPYPWAYVDYGARRDMATNPAYHDKYYGVVNDHWLDLRRKQEILPYLDRLVLEQNQQMATFTGNVDAVQGETTLRTDKLRVFYASDEERQASGNQQSVKRLEAERGAPPAG